MAMWAGVGHRVLAGHTRGAWDVAALPMPDGTTLLASAGDDGSVRLWEPAHGEAVRELVDGCGAVRAVAAIIMADGTTLFAAGGDDRIVRLWSPVTGAVVRTLIGHTGTVRTVVALPTSDGNTLLASAGDDTSIPLWDPVTARRPPHVLRCLVTELDITLGLAGYVDIAELTPELVRVPS